MMHVKTLFLRRTHSYLNISKENNFSIQEILKKAVLFFSPKKKRKEEMISKRFRFTLRYL